MLIVYGGSFNPPTIAHYRIAKYLLDTYPDSKLVFLPTGNKYAKTELAPAKDRISMIQMMVELLGSRTSLSTFEIDQNEYLGTYYSLKHFNNCYYVMGADNLSYIDKWIKYPELVIENKFIIIPRNDFSIEQMFMSNQILNRYRGNFIVLPDLNLSHVSSTLFRTSLDEALVLKEVYKYIIDNKLYSK